MKEFVKLYHKLYKTNMQQLWVDEKWVRNQCIYGVFYDFTYFFKVFIKIHEYANSLICILDLGVGAMCLSFNLVPRSLVYDK